MNIIPIIAKSDAISKSELTKFKIKITSELVSNGVQIYQFPTDDGSVAEINGTMNVSGLGLPPLPEQHCRGWWPMLECFLSLLCLLFCVLKPEDSQGSHPCSIILGFPFFVLMHVY